MLTQVEEERMTINDSGITILMISRLQRTPIDLGALLFTVEKNMVCHPWDCSSLILSVLSVK